MTKSFRKTLPSTHLAFAWPLACLVALIGACPAHASEDQFKQDLDALTNHPHRLAGTAAGAQAADYIETRLNEIGVDEVLPLEFGLWQTKVRQCELRIAGRTITLEPLRPNVVANPVTDAEGLTGPLIYVGQGRLSDYGNTQPEGAIVVLDYASYDNWDLAFSLGAKAVVFLGDQSASTVNPEPLHAGVPARLPRFFARADPQTGMVQGVDLTRRRDQVTLQSRITWERTRQNNDGHWKYVGRNLVGVVRGTQPDFASNQNRPEALVLAAKYDTFGNVPRLTPGARHGANVAALLEAAQHLVADPPRRDVILLFLDNQSRGQQGARELYDALFMRKARHERLIASTRQETKLTRGALEVLHARGLDFKANDRVRDYLLKTLTDVADWQADDQTRAMQIRRLHWRQTDPGQGTSTKKREQIKANARARGRRWDAIRRAMHNDRPRAFLTRQQRYANRTFTNEQQTDLDRAEREALAQRAPKLLDAIDHLKRRTLARLEQRLGQLALNRRVNRQRTKLRQALMQGDQLQWLTAHVSYDLGDASAVWGPVIGGWITKVFPWNPAKPGMDSPGAYTRLLGAIRQVAGARPGKRGIAPPSLRRPDFASTFIPGLFVNSGSIAGQYGIYNLAMMTGYDARIRDGHPADTVANLDWRRLRHQGLEVTRLLTDLADSPGLSQPRKFQTSARSKYPQFDHGKVTGNFAKLQVTGGLSETRPASGALMALWPSSPSTGPGAFHSLSKALNMPGFEPIRYRIVDTNGRFPIKSIRKDVGASVLTLGAMFGPRGRVSAITAEKSLTSELTKAIRVDLFPAKPYAFSWLPTYALDPSRLKVLQGQSNAAFRSTRTLSGQVGAHSAFFVSDQVADQRLKIFQRMGPVVLGDLSDQTPTGTGVAFERFTSPPRLGPMAANNLWRLNEQRLQRLRERGVTSADLERLHGQAGGEGQRGKKRRGAKGQRGKAAEGWRARAEKGLRGFGAKGLSPGKQAKSVAPIEPNRQIAKSPNRQMAETGVVRAGAGNGPAHRATLASREAASRRHLGLSHRVYGPLKQAMNDLVNAIVILLLLAIPFAFAMERLLICATSIYGRIVGFVVMFLVTFLLLYFMHPGFAIATTPIIIFLAFAIILLSGLTIHILTRKFRAELQSMQGQSAGAHEMAASQAGTLFAAVGMGMSTMRRRPTRTALTAITVVMLTFTILCFASFTQKIGIQSLYQGPLTQAMPRAVMLRKTDYSKMPEPTLEMLHGLAGENGLIAPRYWLTPSPTQRTQGRWSVTVVKPATGKSVSLNALMGVDLRSLKQQRWPALGRAISDQPTDQEVSNLADDGVYLPPIARDLLGLKKGDRVLIQGRSAAFAGVLQSAKLQRLRHIDGEPAVPVDFTDLSSFRSQNLAGQASDENPMIVHDIQREFVHLSSEQVAIVSNDLVRRMGGSLHQITMYPEQSIAPSDLGRDVARAVVMPVWAAGREGVVKMLMTRLTEVAGGMQLFVPLLLGGLIIFGTLLGSISDREREIYTFSALGLSPAHVGVLFFAEAAVYAVVGGMGGQLLAQAVALIATELTQAGLIDPITINYSSTNSIFAMAVVMATVIISAIYPAYRASKSANPGLARSWKMPKPDGDDLDMVFPFTVSAYDITGIVSYLAEHFRRHDDAGLGKFAASDVGIRRDDRGELQLAAHLALAPFDLGVTQSLTLTAVRSEIPGVDEVAVHAHRLSGASGDWVRSNRVFIRDLRRQFLIWRTLTSDMIEDYRLETLQTLGESQDPEDDLDHTQPQAN